MQGDVLVLQTVRTSYLGTTAFFDGRFFDGRFSNGHF